MALAITNDKEIGLNGQKYKLVNQLNQRLMSRLPSKVNTGADSYDQENYLSNWIIKDLRGGILIDEMDESIHSDRCWWTNCIISHDGHLLLPRLATALTNNTTSSSAIVNADMELETGWSVNNRSNYIAHGGTYSWKVAAGGGPATNYQDLTGYIRGGAYTFTCWIYTDYLNSGRVALDDGVSVTNGSFVAAGSWIQATVTKTLDASCTRLRLILEGAVNTTYFDDAAITATAFTFGTPGVFCNFNGDCYKSFGRILAKVNRSTGKMDVVCDFGTGKVISALVASLNSRMYIFLGDATNYYWMSTAELFTQSNTAGTYSIQWGDLLWKLTTAGLLTSSSDPDGAGPTWTNEGDITDIADQIETLSVGPDATGASQIYCATNSVLKVYDNVNNKWLDTQVRLPNHPNGGKGACYWNDAIYISVGLGVTKYVTGSTGSISEVGLDRDGGLPVEYNGEIVKFCGDSRYEMFALVDASQVTGTAQSGLYSWNGRAWECYWVDANNDAAMYDVIVSSAESAYAVYWSCGSLVYYIDLPRGLSSPLQLTTQKYAASGIFISSWFDAGSAVFDKLPIVFRTFAKGITTTETVAIKYRTNHTNVDRDTFGTAIETLNTTGENGVNEELLASGAGVKVQAIQYRLDFARGSTETLSPDIQSAVWSYLLLTGSADNKAWDFTINLEGEGDNNTPRQQFTNIWTALTSDTLVPLIFRRDDTTETHYIKLFLRSGPTQTGDLYKGQMALTAIEL